MDCRVLWSERSRLIESYTTSRPSLHPSPSLSLRLLSLGNKTDLFDD